MRKRQFIEALIKVTQDGARDNFALYGYLTPTAFVGAMRDPTSGQHFTAPNMVILPLDFSTDEKKMASLGALHAFTQAAEAFVVATVVEMWLVSLPIEEDFVPPAEHPERTEGVIVQIETADETRTWIATIIRADGEATLGPWEEQSGTRNLGGRIGGFLHKPKIALS